MKQGAAFSSNVACASRVSCVSCVCRAVSCRSLRVRQVQISGAELQELQNEWEDYAFPPVGTAKFVLGMSVIQFIIKVRPRSMCSCLIPE
jgi:hypothetical protein